MTYRARTFAGGVFGVILIGSAATARGSDIHFVLVNREPYPIIEFGVAVSGSKLDWSRPFRSVPAVAQDGTTQVPPGGQIDVTFEPTTQCVWDLGIRTMRQGSPHDVTLGGLNLCKIDHMTLLPNNQYQAKRGGQNVMGSTGEPPRKPTQAEIDACMADVHRRYSALYASLARGNDVERTIGLGRLKNEIETVIKDECY